jgi:hypothetical protein
VGGNLTSALKQRSSASLWSLHTPQNLAYGLPAWQLSNPWISCTVHHVRCPLSMRQLRRALAVSSVHLSRAAIRRCDACIARPMEDAGGLAHLKAVWMLVLVEWWVHTVG